MADNNQQNENQQTTPSEADQQQMNQILESLKRLKSSDNNAELSSMLFDKLFDFTKWVIQYSVENKRINADKQEEQKLQSNPLTAASAVHNNPNSTITIKPSGAKLDNSWKDNVPKNEFAEQARLRDEAKNFEGISLQQKVHRVIVVKLPDGHLKRIDQTHVFTRKGKKNVHTDELQWGEWDNNTFVLPAYAAPVIQGYRSVPDVINALTINPESDDQIVEITYELSPVKETQVSDSAKAEIDAGDLQDAVNEEHNRQIESETTPKREQKHRVSFFKLIWLTLANMLGLYHPQLVPEEN